MILSGSGETDPRWLEKLIKHPPTSLSTLVYWVGQLDIDWDGVEGMGMVMRPDPTQPPRGALRPDVKSVLAQFRHDIHHEDHRRPRDMSLTGMQLRLDVAHVVVAGLLEQQHGPGRALDHDGPVVEYGKWFYLREHGNDGSAILGYEVERPEWAIPPAPRGALENLLHTLHDRLICDTELRPMFDALAPLAAAAGADLWDVNMPNQLDVYFKPAISIASVLHALRWENPVSSSGDVHMSRWRIYPHRPELPWHAPHVNRWHVDVYLDGWPKGPDRSKLPEIGRAGPSPLYDVRGCVNAVSAISIR